MQQCNILLRLLFQLLKVFHVCPSLPAGAEEYSGLLAQTSAQQQTARLIELILTKGNAAAEVFRNWIQKNDVHLLRDLMGMCVSSSNTDGFALETMTVIKL